MTIPVRHSIMALNVTSEDLARRSFNTSRGNFSPDQRAQGQYKQADNLAKSLKGKNIKFYAAPDGLHIIMQYDAYFDQLKYNLKPRAENVIRAIAGEIKACGISAPIEISGHTDNFPNRVGGRSNRENTEKLSEDRALTVHTAMVRNKITNPMSVVARGETQLIVPAGTAAQQAPNRRAEMLIKLPISPELMKHFPDPRSTKEFFAELACYRNAAGLAQAQVSRCHRITGFIGVRGAPPVPIDLTAKTDLDAPLSTNPAYKNITLRRSLDIIANTSRGRWSSDIRSFLRLNHAVRQNMKK